MRRIGPGIALLAAIVLPAAAASAAPAPRPPAFAVCSTCHRTGAGERSPMGPNLWQVGGRRAGTAAGFAYSPAMRDSRLSWNRARLIAFITNPRQVVPGTRMAYAGQRDPRVAAALADYLLSLR